MEQTEVIGKAGLDWRCKLLFGPISLLGLLRVDFMCRPTYCPLGSEDVTKLAKKILMETRKCKQWKLLKGQVLKYDE